MSHGLVLDFVAGSDNPIIRTRRQLSVIIEIQQTFNLCQVRLAYLITNGRLVLTESQTLQCSRLTPQQLNSQILGILFQFLEVISVCQSLTSHVIETSSEVRTVQYQFRTTQGNQEIRQSRGVAGSHSEHLSRLCTHYFRLRAPRVAPTPACFIAYLFQYSAIFSGAFATFFSGSHELCSGP
jgi:hypothetical protein